MHPNLPDIAYYYALKVEARKWVANAISKKCDEFEGPSHWDKITLASIDEEAIEYARTEWPKYHSDNPNYRLPYSWEKLYHRFFRRPSYFDLAIWQIVDGKRILQGLALGKPSNHKTRLSINWIESSFAPTYMQGGILPLVLLTAEQYGRLLGSKCVLIRDATDHNSFMRYGYESVSMKYVGLVLKKELRYVDAEQ